MIEPKLVYSNVAANVLLGCDRSRFIRTGRVNENEAVVFICGSASSVR